MAWGQPREPDELCRRARLAAGAVRAGDGSGQSLPGREGAAGSGASGVVLGLLAWSRCGSTLRCAHSALLPSEQFLNGC